MPILRMQNNSYCSFHSFGFQIWIPDMTKSIKTEDDFSFNFDKEVLNYYNSFLILFIYLYLKERGKEIYFII